MITITLILFGLFCIFCGIYLFNIFPLNKDKELKKLSKLSFTALSLSIICGLLIITYLISAKYLLSGIWLFNTGVWYWNHTSWEKRIQDKRLDEVEREWEKLSKSPKEKKRDIRRKKLQRIFGNN